MTAGNIQVFNNDGVAINIEKIENGESSVVPSARKDDDDDDKAKKIVPIVLLVGVGVVATFWILSVGTKTTNVASPVR